MNNDEKKEIKTVEEQEMRPFDEHKDSFEDLIKYGEWVPVNKEALGG